MNRFFRKFQYLCIASALLLVIDCASKKTSTGTIQSGNQITSADECTTMEEICAEALDFQKEYERLPEEEQEDMASVLTTYVIHCEDARKRCNKSK